MDAHQNLAHLKVYISWKNVKKSISVTLRSEIKSNFHVNENDNFDSLST